MFTVQDQNFFQLFHNLISNAVKAIQQKETCRSPHITHITVHLSKEQGHIVLNLSDTGIGMTTEQQSRAFYRGVSSIPAETELDYPLYKILLAIFILKSILILHRIREQLSH